MLDGMNWLLEMNDVRIKVAIVGGVEQWNRPGRLNRFNNERRGDLTEQISKGGVKRDAPGRFTGHFTE